jgi:ParB family chromosome partitioning protein
MLRKLGRGLDSLIEETKSEGGTSPATVACDRISPNPFQPREAPGDDGLEELTESIRRHGVLQPVVVRRSGEGYELVAGERRWRAARRLGLPGIPVVVREVTDDRMLEIALVENLQREDLNPIEKARAYRRFVDDLDLTHEEAAGRLGMERSSVTNQLRLLELPPDLQEMVSRGTLTMGHARALLSAGDDERRRALARRIEREGLSVRATERLARDGRTPGAPGRGTPAPRSAYMEDLERRIRERFATKARIRGTREKGRIVLEYYTMQELGRLLEILLEE